MRRAPFLSLILIAAFAFNTLLIAGALQAWSGPTATAPSGNVAAPINVGTTDQVKDAGISINALAVFGSGYIEDELGIGRESPVVALDLNGTLRFGNGGETCQAITEGAVRYNSTTKNLELCDGTSWGAIGEGGASLTETFGSNATFNVPLSYSSISVEVRGGSGGGGGGGGLGDYLCCNGAAGGAGGQSKFNSATPVIANGGNSGGGGGGSNCTYAGAAGAAGAAGSASGGDTNTTGGGLAGGTGGASLTEGGNCGYSGAGGVGGASAKAIKTWSYGSAGAPTPGTNISVTVGGAGSGGAGGSGNAGSPGTAGSVVVTWTE